MWRVAFGIWWDGADVHIAIVSRLTNKFLHVWRSKDTASQSLRTSTGAQKISAGVFSVITKASGGYQ